MANGAVGARDRRDPDPDHDLLPTLRSGRDEAGRPAKQAPPPGNAWCARCRDGVEPGVQLSGRRSVVGAHPCWGHLRGHRHPRAPVRRGSPPGGRRSEGGWSVTAGRAPAFNEVIHAPLRLRICGLLRSVDELEFAVVRDALAIDDAKLSKHIKVLTDAGFVSLRKERSASRADSRRLTWVKLTPVGSIAVEAHLAALSAIANGADFDAIPGQA
ncbi:hypothetical protein C5E06_14625 [Pseudoclavibacter sp. RFBI5]|nr:hypothetical protein C5E06_14625 [Pseudoclavibacter sp. RFBI5]